MDGQLFGSEDSPLRENPVFRRYMEEYKIIRTQIDRLQERRGYLSYDEVQELTKLKKLKLSCRDGMEKCKQRM
jgi:uncharacterized protein YdcH (DUF465 family)